MFLKQLIIVYTMTNRAAYINLPSNGGVSHAGKEYWPGTNESKKPHNSRVENLSVEYDFQRSIEQQEEDDCLGIECQRAYSLSEVELREGSSDIAHLFASGLVHKIITRKKQK